MYELTGYEEHLQDTELAYGDPRHCPIHRHVMTSSPDGMHDAPCGECEADMAQAADMWDIDPANPHRPYCGNETYIAMPWRTAKCTDIEDNIPF